jgi:lysophospholipase L1-like esterase
LDNHLTQKLPFRRKLVYASVIYFAFLFVLLAVELITRATLPHLSSLELFVATPQQQMQVADPKHSAIFEGDPLLLWRLKPNLHNEVWDFTVLSTNPQGLRASYPTDSKPPGTYRIVCLGDSVTFGYRVPVVWPDKPTEFDPEWVPFPMLLEMELRQANQNRAIEVFPMAVPGYTSHQGLAWLRRDIKRLQPDMIIISFGWNDVSLSDAPDRLAIRTDWYPVAIRWLIDHSQAFARTTKWLRPKEQKPARRQLQPRVSQDEFVNNMNAIVNLAREHGARAVVIGAPYRDATTNPGEAQLMSNYRAALRSMMQRRDIPYLQVLELTEAAAPVNDGFFGELIHPNHIGHRLLASELLKLIGQKRLLGEINVPEMVP